MSTGKLCCEDERRKRKETKKVINHFPLHFLCVNCKLLSLVYLFHVPSNGSLDWKRSIFCFSYTFSYVDPIVTQSFLSLWIWAPILPEENCSRVVVGGWMLKFQREEDEEKLYLITTTFIRQESILPGKMNVEKQRCWSWSEKRFIFCCCIFPGSFIYSWSWLLRCCAAGEISFFKFVCNPRHRPPAPS